MQKPFKVSSRLAPLMLATASLSLLALHCSSDEGAQTAGTGGISTPTAGAGSPAQQAGSTSGGMSTGGVASGGVTSGGMATAGATTGGTPGGSGGSGGSAGGTGGATGGVSAGGSSGSGGGGASGVTFVQVKALLAKSCAGMKCHDAASSQMDWTTSDGLYMRLTTAVPADILCKGKVPVVPNMPDQSLLIQAVKGLKPTCDKPAGGTEALVKMPDDCPQPDRPCLTDAEIKLLSDWITAGAPQ